MSKKPSLRIEVRFDLCSKGVMLVCGDRWVYLRDSHGNSDWFGRRDACRTARRVAKWWADKLGLPVVEVKG